MWKAGLAGVAALVTLGVSLVSGEGIRRETEELTAPPATSNQQPSRPTPAGTVATSQPTAPRAAPSRLVALVIGNAVYPDADLALGHPVNGARALADALRDKGFDVVRGENLSKQEMHRAIESFTSKITPGSAALIFFSGFGIQASRKTYLIPVNAQIWTEDDVRRAGVSVEPILGEMESRGAGVKLIILDAARRNPFERRFRGFSAGLAGIYAPDETLVMYSAAPGKVVNDAGGEHSILVSELIAQIRAPGQSAEEAFNRTRLAVSQASGRSQVPWVSSSLIESFFFGSPEPPSPAPHNPR
jgi:uncharacterized caspase-like protein